MGVEMQMDAMILDGKGIPYSTQRFEHEPESAQDFLSHFERHSIGYLDQDWRERPQNDLVNMACKALAECSGSLEHSYFLKARVGHH